MVKVCLCRCRMCDSCLASRRTNLVRCSRLQRTAWPTARVTCGSGGRCCCSRLFGNASKVLIHPLLLRAKMSCPRAQCLWQRLRKPALEDAGIKVTLSCCCCLQANLQTLSKATTLKEFGLLFNSILHSPALQKWAFMPSREGLQCL